MRYLFYTVDVFTDNIFGGNQLAVFPRALGLNPQQMQLIAREFNFSETVFVLADPDPQLDRCLRIFTPTRELPFAGHPIIGTAYLLASIAEIPLQANMTIFNLKTGSGLIQVKVFGKNNLPNYVELTAARLPEFRSKTPSITQLANLLTLESSEIINNPRDYPQAISCGLPFLIIPLVDRAALGSAKLNLELWAELLRDDWASSVYIFTYDTEFKDSEVRARMFAPGLGVAEDPATGSAATALAAYLGSRDRDLNGAYKWQIEQGFEMGRPSRLFALASKQNGKIVATGVGGAAVLVTEGTMVVPQWEN